jgi:helix-turn-helix protein
MADTAWTIKKIRKLGMTTDVETAAEILDIGRTKAYELAKSGEFPVPVLRIGIRYVVPIPPILALLAGEDHTEREAGANVSITLTPREADALQRFITASLLDPIVAHHWAIEIRYLNAVARKISRA